MSDSEDDSPMSQDGQQQYDPTMEGLMKMLLGKKGIKTKDAAEVGKKRVTYMRGKDFTNFLVGESKFLKQKCSKVLNKYLEGEAPKDNEDVKKLGQEMIRLKFIAKAVNQPLSTSSNREDGENSRRKEKKWPDRLVRDARGPFDPDGFYIILYEGSNRNQIIMLVLMVLCVLLGAAWQVWPFWAKVAIWYLAMALLTILIGIEIVRNSCFALVWVVGYDFWIFPNLNDEYCSFVDSFKPVWSVEKRSDSFTYLIVRVGVLFMYYVGATEIAKTHSMSDVKDFVSGSYGDILDWGKDYLRPQLAGGRGHIPSIAHLEEEERLAQEAETKDQGERAAAAAAVAEDAPEDAGDAEEGGEAGDAEGKKSAVIDEEGNVVEDEEVE